MKLSELIIASATRYARKVIEQIENPALTEQNKADITRFLQGAYVSGMATLAHSQCVMDGSDALDPRAVLKACEEIPTLLNMPPMVAMGGAN